MYFLKLDNLYIGNELNSLKPVLKQSQALQIRRLKNTIKHLKSALSLALHVPRYRYILENIEKIKIVNSLGTEFTVDEDTTEIYCLYVSQNNEKNIAADLKNRIDNNLFNKDELLRKNIIDKNFFLSDYIYDVMFPESFDIDMNLFISKTRSYIFIQVEKTSIAFFNDVIKKFLLSIPGIYGIVGTKIETPYKKKERFTKNKREVVKNTPIFVIKPSPVRKKDIENISISHNSFSLYDNDKNYEINDSVFYWRYNRKGKKIYVPAKVVGIKDEFTFILNVNNAIITTTIDNISKND